MYLRSMEEWEDRERIGYELAHFESGDRSTYLSTYLTTSAPRYNNDLFFFT